MDDRLDATLRASLASIATSVPHGRDDIRNDSHPGFLGPPTFTLRLADNKFGLPGAWQLALQRHRNRTSHSLS